MFDNETVEKIGIDGETYTHSDVGDGAENNKIGWRYGEHDDCYYVTDGNVVLHWSGIEDWDSAEIAEGVFDEWLSYVGEGEDDVKVIMRK